MIKIISSLATVFFLSAPAFAQEFAATLGVQQTTADSNLSGVSVDGKLNFRAGALIGFELVDKVKFRSGLIYTQRHFDVKAGTATLEYKFDYFDVPALVQYNFSEMIGLFGGLNFGININDDVTYPAGTTATDPDAEKLIPLMTLGVNLMFNDMIGFDFYFERGMGKLAKNLENYSTFGGNFIYWF